MISSSAKSSAVGFTAVYKPGSVSATINAPQRIAIIAQGQDSVTYSTDKFSADGSAQTVGQILGFKSPAYMMAREMFPLYGDGVGSIPVDVIPLEKPSGGIAATGSITVLASTAVSSLAYGINIGGYSVGTVSIPAGVVNVDKAMSDISDVTNSFLYSPATATNVYGVPTVTNGPRITLSLPVVAGSPKGGSYKVICTVGGGTPSFELQRPDGTVIGTFTNGAQAIDGLTFTVASASPLVGDSSLLNVLITSVTLTATWKGLTGNDISLSISGGASNGVSFTTTDFTNGAGESDLDSALSKIGDSWVTMIATSEKSTTALDKFSIWGESRWEPLTAKFAVVIYGNTSKTVALATAGTIGRTADRTTVQIANPGSSSMPFLISAATIAKIAPIAQSAPAHDYGGTQLPTLNLGADADVWNDSQRNLALVQGSGTTENTDNLVTICDIVTGWRPVGEEPPAFRYVVDIVRLMQVASGMNNIFKSKEWRSAPLVDSSDGVTEPTAKTPSMAVTATGQLIDGLFSRAIITNPDEAKKSVIATIGAGGKRLNVTIQKLTLSGNTNIIDNVANFSFPAGN